MSRRRNYFKLPKRRHYGKVISNRDACYVAAAILFLSILLTYPWQTLSVIIIILAGVWHHRNKKKELLRVSGIREIDRMEGTEFEDRIKLLFEDRGYSVEETPTTGDFGADLIANGLHERIVIQCKRYSYPVGLRAVQEAATAVMHYSAHRAMVITNNRFTDQAHKLAQTKLSCGNG